MKKIATTLILGALITLTGSLSAQRPHYKSEVRVGQDARHPGIHGNAMNLHQVLNRQFRNGHLTRPEYRQYKRELEYIDLMQDMARADGRVTRREKRLLQATKQDFLDNVTRRRHRGRHN